MLNVKLFEFQKDNKTITIKIEEKCETSFNSYVWPSAPVLCYFLLNQDLQNKKLLEIGSGTGLPGLLAHHLGADVALTDIASSLHGIKRTLQLNSVDNVKVKELEWGVLDNNIVSLGYFDYIIASDCFYDTKDFESILVTIVYFFRLKKSAQFWLTYEIRSSNRSIEHLLNKWELECENIPLNSFLPSNYIYDQAYMPSIMMLIIKPKNS